ncbi:MAG: hypothetical protein N2043_06315 [Ignavibacterium sp.]|nr:hypothetical protein [Ignavibacterium sp.]
MTQFNEILTSILLISAAMLCIALIYYVKRIVNSVEELKNEIKNLNSSISPLIDTSIDLAKNLNDFSIEAKTQLQTSKKILEEIRTRVNKLIEFEEKISVGIDDFAKPFLSNLYALKNGITAFWKKIRDK